SQALCLTRRRRRSIRTGGKRRGPISGSSGNRRAKLGSRCFRLAGSAGQRDYGQEGWALINREPNNVSGDSAKRIADEIAPLISLARSGGFDFLAYLLAMALKEARGGAIEPIPKRQSAR